MSETERQPCCEFSPGWNLDTIVSGLREQRRRGAGGEEAGHRERPSRDALADIMRALRAAMFPEHFGPANVSGDSVDFFVGHALDGALRSLAEQARRELRFSLPNGVADRRASDLITALSTRIPEIRGKLWLDAQAALAGDPAAKSLDEVLSCYPGITAISHHRFAHELYTLGLTLLARMVAELAHATTGIDIHPGATIGERFFIDHGTGVVIGETARIGNNVRLYQGVTLGARRFPTDEHGVIIKGAPRHPILEDDVVIYAGATVLGRITIGRGSSIGGNVWLTRGVPPGSTISQAQHQAEGLTDGAGI